MPNQITWTTVFLVLGPAVVAALATLAGSWLSNHFQLKNKKLEIESQTNLKAKELYFNAYQQQLERISVAASNASETIYRGIAQIMSADTEDEKEKQLEDFLAIFKALDIDIRDNIKALEEELKGAGLFEQAEQDLTFIRENFGVDPQSLTTKDIEALTFKLGRAHDIETKILTALVTKKREDLFGEYLGTTRSVSKK